MKKGHIIGLGVIGIAIMIIITSIGDASTYENFSTAKSMADNGNSEAIHVVGGLKKDESGTVLGLDISEDKTSLKAKAMKMAISGGRIDHQRGIGVIFFSKIKSPMDILRRLSLSKLSLMIALPFLSGSLFSSPLYIMLISFPSGFLLSIMVSTSMPLITISGKLTEGSVDCAFERLISTKKSNARI